MATARTRYIGSNRPREAGFSAAHKQDFIAHVTGGDWIHLASQISVTGIWGNVQAELDDIISSISILSETVINPSLSSTPNAVVIFGNSGGRVVTESSPYTLKVDPTFGDIILPNTGSFTRIYSASTNSVSQGQSLRIVGQHNNGSGPGGELWLSSGVNFISGNYESDIVLIGAKLAFEWDLPISVITQRDSGFDIAAKDFILAAQNNFSSTAAPGNIWVQSGGNNIGESGDINLYCYPGAINIISSGLFFDSTTFFNAPPVIIQRDLTVAGDGQQFFISAQNVVNGMGGSLLLSSGIGTTFHGNITLDAHNTNINAKASRVVFDVTSVTPTITQEDIDAPVANDMMIIAQSIFNGAFNTSGTPGNIWLESGYNYNDGNAGSIFIFSDTGPTVLLTSQLEFGVDYSPNIVQQPYTTGIFGNADAWPFLIKAQENTEGKGGDLNLQSGSGLTDFTGFPGVDGDININAGLGQVNISGTNFNGFAGINLQGPIYIVDGTPGSDVPNIGGGFLFAHFGILYWRDPSGVDTRIAPPLV